MFNICKKKCTTKKAITMPVRLRNRIEMISVTSVIHNGRQPKDILCHVRRFISDLLTTKVKMLSLSVTHTSEFSSYYFYTHDCLQINFEELTLLVFFTYHRGIVS